MQDDGTQIRIKKTTVEQLNKFGKRGESYNDIIIRALKALDGLGD